eukprot:c12745_g1_i1.p1 GENE.c12745_g1_i1~~c12745_g1_i1.p1  ORF type:complete len:451 (-),score=64.25 c12745_g1_i1:66-1229(-)
MSNSSNTSTKRIKKKVTLWTEKHNSTVAVVGIIQSHEQFRLLLSLIRERVGDTKSHYFREDQLCGFVYFHDDQTASKCKEIFNGFLFEGVVLRACSPTQYFPSEDDIFPDIGSNTRKPSSTSSHHYASEPTPTLVLKNLCFGLKQNKFLEFMASRKAVPHSVSYHYDSNGLFRGVAFAKYNTVDQATEALNELQGTQINGRVIKAEFKRRGTGGDMPIPSPSTPTRPRQDSPFVPSPTQHAHLSPSHRSPNTSPLTSHHTLKPIGPNHSVDPIASAFGHVADDIGRLASDEDDSSEESAPIPSPKGRNALKGCRAVGAGVIHNQQPTATPFQLFPASPVLIKPGAEFPDLSGTFTTKSFSRSNPPPPVKMMFPRDCVPILREGLEFA